MTIKWSFSYNSFVNFYGKNLGATMLYPNLCYNKVSDMKGLLCTCISDFKLSLPDGDLKVVKFVVCCCILEASKANSADPSQAALYDLSSKYSSLENAHFNRYRASNK